MNPPIRSVGNRDLAVAFCAIISAACSSTTTVPQGEPLIPTPFVEHSIEVRLPGPGVTDNELRKQYGEHGRWAIGHTRPRCVKGTSGSACETVNVRITAVEGAKYIDPAKPPKRPQLLAWVENFGDKSTADGFEPVKQFVYALVVAAPAANDPVKNAIIYKVGFSTDAKRSSVTDPVEYGRVFACHDYTPHLISEADFQPCHRQQRLYVNRAEKWPLNAIVSSFLTWSVSAAAQDPTWFSCSSGCCTSSSPD